MVALILVIHDKSVELKIIFLISKQYISCGYSNGPSRDGSFEYQKQMFKLMDKKNNYNFVLKKFPHIWTYVC